MSATSSAVASAERQAFGVVHECQVEPRQAPAHGEVPCPDDFGAADAELLRQIAQGNHEAFEALYQRHGKRLRSLAEGILHDPPESEDVLQEVFLIIWAKAACFNESLGRPLGWLFAITRNKAIERLRARGRRLQGALDDAGRPFTAHQVPAPHPQEGIRADESTQVLSAVRVLANHERRPIELAYLGGLSHPEVARLLQQPLGTVKARIRRGLVRLRLLLKGTEAGALVQDRFAVKHWQL